MSEKQTARLDNWSVSMVWGGPQLLGDVSGHPRLKDGEEIRTSIILRLDSRAGTAETLNTNYTLGNPHPKWVLWLQKEGRSVREFDMVG